MRAEDDLVGTFHAGDQTREHAADFFRRGEADRVGQIDRGGAGGDRHAGDLGQEIFFGASCILGRKFHIVDIAARQRYVPVHRFQHLLAAHAQLVLAMQRAGGQEHMQARVCSCFQRLGRGFDIGLQAARQYRQGRASQFAAHHRHRFAVRMRTGGKTGFDDVHAEFVQRARHDQLLLGRHAAAGGLLAVAQGGVENSDTRGLVGYGRVHQEDSSTAMAVTGVEATADGRE